MQKLTHSIFINAPREKVWSAMLDQDTYKEWTKAFNPTSHYVGDWSAGSEMKFLGFEENGQTSGMYSKIADNKPLEFISIEHLGMISNGEIDTTSDEVKKWAPSYENYTFTDKDGGTEVLVEVSVPDDYKETFDKMWQEGLEILKTIAERE